MTPDDLAAIRARDAKGRHLDPRDGAIYAFAIQVVRDRHDLLAEVDRLTAENADLQRVMAEVIRASDGMAHARHECGRDDERARIVQAIRDAPDIITLSGPVAGAIWRPDLLRAIGEPNGLEDTFR
jgi:hypothetical protein